MQSSSSSRAGQGRGGRAGRGGRGGRAGRRQAAACAEFTCAIVAAAAAVVIVAISCCFYYDIKIRDKDKTGRAASAVVGSDVGSAVGRTRAATCGK